ncbi:MAG TPA: isoprenylcysteine carboxylmethyltransferase family protein [Hypericibacter adhaerens]|uniref:methyltransferase family protein n=1 Tax=Hypericibacter adhaerens TaxID=2602016 RepID=UPI002B55866A|nr:isoprenylcysteine carboxylmethyltransferase family protein [Hypericibacter adhaerens]HWA45435.1 isoprenylcysteine carboxylmethyltransferase family protein [Hypericibacter adhaerens]
MKPAPPPTAALPAGADERAARERLRGLQRRRKLVILFASLAVALLIPFLRSLGDWNGSLHETVEAVGFAAIVLCILGRAWCALYIGGRKANRLVTEGPYSLSRNPLYLFSFLGAAGIGAQTGSLAIAALFAAGAIAIFRPAIQREEAALQTIFGQAYEDYRRRTPRFGPRLTAWHDATRLEIHPQALYRTIADGLVFAALVPLFELVDWAQAAGYLGVIAKLP